MPDTTPTPPPSQPLGFGRAAAERQLAAEERLRGLAGTESVCACSRALAAAPHIAGTPGQAATRDYVLERMREWGLETDVAEYDAYLPQVTAAEVELLGTSPRLLTLTEPVLPGAHALPFIPQHAYAAAGEATGELVCVNYGTVADLDRLAAAGVELRGKIALARYGQIFRGLKVLNVQARGAVACLLYCDPHDDGYFRGDVYPEGPMRPLTALQQGSLHSGPPGDPIVTRGFASTDAPRGDRGASPFLPKIPSHPLRGDVAAELLQALRGPEVPQEWQGALPFRYHLGPGPVRVRIRIASDNGRRPIWNTFGRLTGTTHPDEWIIIGAHRDAWSTGAADNVSGVVTVMEAARLCAALARQGHAPRRTLIFATWDAEEWGIVGSGEWVRQHHAVLAEQAVAYINQDMSAFGPEFSAGGSPCLRTVMRQATATVPAPDQAERTLYDVWSADKGAPPAFPLPGGGSDHEAFLFHLGIPAAGCSYAGRMGVYHSIYDTTDWLERFGDPGYRRHSAVGRLVATAALRIANADVRPLDYASYVEELLPTLAGFEMPGKVSAAVAGALDEAREALRRFGAISERAGDTLRRADLDAVPPAVRDQCGRQLQLVEQAFLSPADLEACRGDEFNRHRLCGTQSDSGYGGQLFPGLQAARAANDTTLLARELAALTESFARAGEHLSATIAALAPAAR